MKLHTQAGHISSKPWLPMKTTNPNIWAHLPKAVFLLISNVVFKTKKEEVLSCQGQHGRGHQQKLTSHLACLVLQVQVLGSKDKAISLPDLHPSEGAGEGIQLGSGVVRVTDNSFG